ncbi:MAG TPA: hypothetical protein VGA20_01495 [Gemmatimonadales bacterium]
MKKFAVMIGSGLLAFALIGVMALLMFAAEGALRGMGVLGH